MSTPSRLSPLVVCSICRSPDRFEQAPDACRHPIHWPDRDPERPYFPECIVINSGPARPARTIADAALSALVEHWAGCLGLEDGMPLAACWAADIRTAAPIGGVLAVACRWVEVR